MELHIRTNGSLIIEITGYSGVCFSEKPIFEIHTLTAKLVPLPIDIKQDVGSNDMLLYALNTALKNFENRLLISKLKVTREQALYSCCPEGRE